MFEDDGHNHYVLNVLDDDGHYHYGFVYA